jgi:hypothetical protein
MGDDPGIPVRVECAAGPSGEERPRAFLLGDRRVTVVETLDWWPGSDHRYFKVQGDDGGLYILRHDLLRDQWEVTLFEQWPGPESP